MKHAIDRSRAEAFPPDQVARRIETAAREALQQLAEAKLLDWPGPYRFALTFEDSAQAQSAALVPGTEILANQMSVQLRANDFEEGYRLSLRWIRLAYSVASSDANDAVINAQPNKMQLQTALIDWFFDRSLKGSASSETPAVSSPNKRARYWGAR